MDMVYTEMVASLKHAARRSFVDGNNLCDMHSINSPLSDVSHKNDLGLVPL